MRHKIEKSFRIKKIVFLKILTQKHLRNIEMIKVYEIYQILYINSNQLTR